MFYLLILVVFSLSVILIFYRYILGILFRLIRPLSTDLSSHSLEVEKDYTWQPFVSFMIPCFNEGEHIYSTIKSILSQDWPKDKLEVIVIDDKSSDDTHEWALKAKELGMVTVVRNKTNMGKRRCLVLATEMAQGEICVSVDSDVVVAEDALKELVACFPKNPNIAAVGGLIGVSNTNVNWITKSQTIKYFFSQELFKSTENLFRTVFCLSGCLTAYRKKPIADLGKLLWRRKILGAPIKYGEDRYLTHLLILNGWNTIVNLDARCWTKTPETMQTLFSQQLRWRRSNIVDWILTIRTLRKHFALLNPLVLLGYFSLMAYVIIYPLMISYLLISGFTVFAILIHIVALLLLAGMYKIMTILRGVEGVNNPAVFLYLAIILFVSYLIVTPLAMFTLSSVSWETRQKKEEYQGET